MYGIDVSTYQRLLDMEAVKAAGNEFVGVKAVASYRPELTVADHYAHNVDRVMAAGLPKYPYAVPNSQNSPEQTAAFFWANRYRPTDRDCYMLDNEPLDTYKVFWGDDDVYRFWREMETLGMRMAQAIQYCPAHLTRQQQWPKLRALREEGLKIQWVSYGDNDPYYEDGEEPFVGTTGLDNPEMHQFTSSYTIPGYGGLIDRVHSRLTAAQLFGGPMPRTPAGMIAWARNEAAKGNVRKDWAGWCELLINNAGAFNQAFSRALYAGDASGPLRTDYANAPVGAILYWSGVWIGGKEYGHDAYVVEKGADPLLLMASAAVDTNWGHNIGTIRLSRYQAKFGHPLRGWTLRHGTETLDFSGPAGIDDKTPINNYSNGGNNMYFLRTVDTTVYFVTESGWEPVKSISHLNLLQRFVKAFPSFDTFNAAERDIIFSYIALAQDFTDTQFAELREGLANINVSVDSAAISDALVAAVTQHLAEHGVSVDTAGIATAVQDVLADDFASIPGAVVFKQGEALSNG